MMEEVNKVKVMGILKINNSTKLPNSSHEAMVKSGIEISPMSNRIFDVI